MNTINTVLDTCPSFQLKRCDLIFYVNDNNLQASVISGDGCIHVEDIFEEGITIDIITKHFMDGVKGFIDAFSGITSQYKFSSFNSMHTECILDLVAANTTLPSTHDSTGMYVSLRNPDIGVLPEDMLTNMNTKPDVNNAKYGFVQLTLYRCSTEPYRKYIIRVIDPRDVAGSGEYRDGLNKYIPLYTVPSFNPSDHNNLFRDLLTISQVATNSWTSNQSFTLFVIEPITFYSYTEVLVVNIMKAYARQPLT